MTHTCTSCGITINYINKESQKNAKHNLKKNGFLKCATCAGKEGQLSRKTKPTGRPKGIKNKDNSNIKNNLRMIPWKDNITKGQKVQYFKNE